ncbi:vacuolar protein sorting-associated protein 11, partial [Tremellales sp. Uapishka_1]
MASTAAAGPSQVSMSAPQWRQFTFFDVEEVKDVEDLALGPKSLRDLSLPILLTPTSPSSPLPSSLLLSSSTSISSLDRHFTAERTFKAWDNNGRGMAMLEAGGLLVGIGEEEGSRYPVLKVWDMSREEKKKAGGGPVLMRNVRIQHGQRPHPVSSIALTSNLSHLAIGLGDGTVLLYRHLLQSLTTSPTSLTSLPKARVIHESSEPITGLGFREPSSSTTRSKAPENSNAVSLFIVTTNRVLCAPVSGKGGETRTIDELGCGLGCAVMDWDKREMIIARDEAIYLYGPEGRGACYAYEGPKSSITAFKHNLIIVSPPFLPSAASNSATVRHYVSKAPNDLGSDIAKIAIFDLQNKLVSYSGTFRDGVREIVCQWGGIFVYGGSGKLSRLDEHSTAAKLEVLYRRNLYTLAISLAKSQGISEAGVGEIHKRYGDYLYGKGDFDGSMSQFVKTLGFLQPSYVIRKFLDAQRIHNLTTYLQELHSRNLANPDHTTLLLNCYTKTSDRARLDSFIKTESQKSDDLDDLPFDLDTAIRVCRQAGFFEHATYLARKYGRHEEYLRIQIEDAEEYQDALRYLRGLGPEACEDNLVRYGKTLLQKEPNATTELLIDLCSGDLGKKLTLTSNIKQVNGNGNGSSGPAMLSYLGYNRVQGLFSGDTAEKGEDKPGNPGDEEKKADIEDIQATYDPPSPRQFFAHFVDHHDLFILFLESISKLSFWDLYDQKAIWNTLLELYLSSPESSTASHSRIMELLKGGDEKGFDKMHALILCSLNNFTDGLVSLWESMGMYEDVLRFWMESTQPDALSNVFKGLDKYGPSNPHLYPLVLRYLTSDNGTMAKDPTRLRHLLEVIDQERILPPLAVVQLLSRNNVASVGSVKDWLREKVKETRQDVDSDKHLVASYRSETAAKEKEIKELTNTSQPEVFQVTRCAACSGQLDLPSVHFMCKHSYHQRCLSDSEPECLLCSRQHSVVREIRRNQTRLADRHDLFLGEVHDAEDGFGVVAGAFGRGLFQNPTKEGDV